MSVGGVGGVGGSAGGAGVGSGGAGSVGGSDAAGGAPAVGGEGTVGGTEGTNSDSAKEVGDKDTGVDPNKHSHVSPMGGQGCNMSTQSFISLHNSSVQQVNEAQSPDMDLKKLMEMMMAIKLLQEMNKNG